MAEPTFTGFPDGTFAFLRDIARHNEKAWFDAHRGQYQTFYVNPALAFVAAVGPKLRTISPTVAYDPRVNGSLFRINRDVRFSKDKTLYRDHLDLWFWHGDRRGWDMPGFFFRLAADRLILGAGMHRFAKVQLDAYRDAVVEEKSGRALAKVIDEVRAAGPFIVGGATRKVVPRGYDVGHARAGLLLHEGLWAETEGAVDPSVRSVKFVDFCVGQFRAMWPIGRWLLGEVCGGR